MFRYGGMNAHRSVRLVHLDGKHAAVELRRGDAGVRGRPLVRLDGFRVRGGLCLAQPRGAGLQRADDVPRVGPAEHVLDAPAWRRAAVPAAGPLELVERLGVEDVVPRKEREHHARGPMRGDVVLQHQQLLLRPEACRSVVLHRDAEPPLQLRRPRLLDGHRHRVGERVAERRDVEALARRRIAEPFSIGHEVKPVQHPGRDRRRDDSPCGRCRRSATR